MEAEEKDLSIEWVDHGERGHRVFFGTMEASVQFPGDNMTVISVIARDAEGDDPIQVVEQFYSAKADLKSAKAHAIKLAGGWLRHNLEALGQVNAAELSSQSLDED